MCWRVLLRYARYYPLGEGRTRRAREGESHCAGDARRGPRHAEALWVRAYTSADETNAEAKSGFNLRIQGLEKENVELHQLIGEVEQDRDKTKEMLKERDETIVLLSVELDQIRAARDAAHARLDERDAILELVRKSQRMEK